MVSNFLLFSIGSVLVEKKELRDTKSFVIEDKCKSAGFALENSVVVLSTEWDLKDAFIFQSHLMLSTFYHYCSSYVVTIPLRRSFLV